MAEFNDPDLQDELAAMSGSPKTSLFGGRMTSKNEPRPAKVGRQAFAIETIANPFIAANVQQQNIRSFSPPPVSKLSTTDKATKMELEAILRKPAHTSEEKFLVLEARDKLMRLTTAKNVDIKRAASIKGVCPDMCPEKERLSRESKHRVACFELEHGSKSIMNNRIAVKEYSRSSADQETPLSHELRPEPVLKLTMTYLLQNIMDLCDDPDTSICDWFHFLWDRTRGIRKEITQQELCSTETVLLVEQCARFHIHSAARLIAEEPQVFDQKINTENLTKCLQSLKYMYHDLGLKMIRCPNEAEFRAYVVLLNLHDSNFLWEVKQLREDIMRSPEIQFAIKVYLALESHNYVRFFALVRSTTYMNSCILLRYFTQVRVKAMQVIFKSYAPRNAVYMSISKLTYLLAFEDFEQCTQFLEYYGLTCEPDEDRVILDRNSLFFPDSPFLLDRAINIVEHKRHCSVGEAVHGCPLDSKNILEKYEPHDSFDENGILLPKAWTAEDQNYYKPEARIEARLNKTPIPAPMKEDEIMFKMPQAPPKVSPRSRLSPKTVLSTENSFIIPANNTSSFASNKLAPSTQNSSMSLFKIQTNQAATTSIFGDFTQGSSDHKSIFGNKLSEAEQPAKSVDLGDGKTFRFTSNAAFGKPTGNTAPPSGLFTSGLSQTPALSTNLFPQVKREEPKNVFVNAAASMFNSFSTVNRSQETSGFMGKSAFQAPTSSAQIGLFGGFKSSSTSIPGVEPLKDTDDELMAKQREKEEAKRKELEQKKIEAEELERKRKAELEEKERQSKKAEEERQRQLEQKRLQIERAAKQFLDEIIDEQVSQNLQEIASSEFQRHRKIEEKIAKIYEDLQSEFINSALETIVTDEKLAWDKNVLGKYFISWRTLTRKKIEQRKKIENTPVWLPKRSMDEALPELCHPSQAKTLSLMKRYRSGLPSKLIAPPIRDDSIDLWQIIAPELTKLIGQRKGRQMQNIYWKCVISLPDVDEDPSSHFISQWLENVFYRQTSKHPRQKDTFFVEQCEINHQRLNVCLRKLSGRKLVNEMKTPYTPKDVEGTNAILFFMTTKNMQATRARLQAALQATELNNAAAFVIYNSDGCDTINVKTTLNLYDYMDFDSVDECIFGGGPKHRNANNVCHLTKLGLKYVAAKSFYDDQLEMQQIVPFLRVCLAEELWQRIYLSVSRNPTLHEASTRFDFLADYHNDAIDRLISICSPSCIDSPTLFSSELRQFVPKIHLEIPLPLEYFPENWHQKAETHQQQLVEFLKTLKIQQNVDIKHVTDTEALQTAILKFVSAHIPVANVAERTAYKMLQQILAFLGTKQLNQLEFKEILAQYSWLGVIPIFSTELLSFQYQRFVNEQRLPEYVIYDKYEYEDYNRTAWWLEKNVELLKSLTANVIRDIDLAADEYDQACKRQRLDETLAIEEQKKLDDILAKGYETLASADKILHRMKEIHTTCKEISKDFDYDLYQQERVMREMKDSWKHFNE